MRYIIHDVLMGRQSEYGIVCVPIHDVLTRALFAYKKHDEAVLKNTARLHGHILG